MGIYQSYWLNFDQGLAEEPNMNKVDSFFVTIIVLISLFFVVYKTAEFQFSGVEFERQKNKQLSRYIAQLKLKEKVAELEKTEAIKNDSTFKNTRSIASIEAVKPVILAHKLDTSKEMMDPSALAEAYYKKAKLNCEKYKKEEICTQNIDVVVTQFPESRWAGESLILLSRLYLKTRHVEKAREVMKIIATQFKADKEIQSKLRELERSRL